MQSMTIEQLRAVSDAGGVEGVILKGQGGVFFVQIATRSGARFAGEGPQQRATLVR